MQFALVSKYKIRQKALQYRATLERSEKELLDNEIINNLTALKEYIDAKTVYVYVSKENEIDTIKLIEKSLKNGKKVAVPKCISKTEMKFYYIDSLSQLKIGKFGVLEPIEYLVVSECTENAFMVVPSLAADIFGYRVGYGKGFYDRYLSNNPMPTAILCYRKYLYFKLLHDKYDFKCDYIVTDRKTFKRKGIKHG